MHRHIFLIILIILIFSQFIFWLPGKTDKYEQKNVSEKNANLTTREEQTLKGGYMVESQTKDRAWEIWSAVAKKTSSDESWNLEKVKASFFSNSILSYAVTGDKGLVKQSVGTIKIWGNVELKTEDGYVITTDNLYYNPEDKKLDTKEIVKVVGPEEEGGRLTLRGTGLLAYLENETLTLLDNVQAERPMKLNRTMYINSKTAVFKENSKSVLFNKDVLIKVGTMKVTGPRAMFKYKSGILDSLLIDGGVKLEDVDKWGTSGKATIYFNEDKCVFDDQPNMIQGQDELHGEQIVVLDQGNVLKVKGTKARYFQKSSDR